MEERETEKPSTPSVCSASIVQGYLRKLSPSPFRGWQRRFFVLDDSSLRYWRSREEHEQGGNSDRRGVVELARVDRISDSNNAPDRGIDIHYAGGRTYSLLAESASQKGQWMSALNAKHLNCMAHVMFPRITTRSSKSLDAPKLLPMTIGSTSDEGESSDSVVFQQEDTPPPSTSSVPVRPGIIEFQLTSAADPRRRSTSVVSSVWCPRSSEGSPVVHRLRTDALSIVSPPDCLPEMVSLLIPGDESVQEDEEDTDTTCVRPLTTDWAEETDPERKAAWLRVLHEELGEDRYDDLAVRVGGQMHLRLELNDLFLRIEREDRS